MVRHHVPALRLGGLVASLTVLLNDQADILVITDGFRRRTFFVLSDGGTRKKAEHEQHRSQSSHSMQLHREAAAIPTGNADACVRQDYRLSCQSSPRVSRRFRASDR